MPLRDLLAALASPAPTPAGGSASALASALGVSLLMMAASLVESRTDSAADREILSEAWRSLAPLQQALTAAVDDDSTAYEEVASARRLYRSPANKVIGAPTLQMALQGATDVPLQVMRMSTDALRLAVAVAERCHRPAISDVRVAIGLIRAGLTGAQSSAEADLALLANSPYVEGARAEIEELSGDAVRSADAAEQSLASA